MRGFFIAFVASVAAFCCGAAQAEKKVALVIGNDRYTNLPVLQKAVNDAEVVGNTLARLGFEVIRGRNLGRQGMIDKLAEFTARLEAGDTALFFYAGHGVAIGGVNYLVPSDVPAASAGAEGRVRGASIAESDIISEVQAKGPRVAVLVLDACRDNPFPRAGTRTLGGTSGLADAKPARGVFTLYSAGIGQTALDRLEPNDANPNSVFTRVFVEQLAKPGLHIGELAIEVREKVAEIALKARNTRGEADPHEQTPAYYDQTIGGRVFLAGRAIPGEPASEAKPPRVDPCAAALDHWRSTEAIGSLAVLEDHLARFPDCAFAALARARIEDLKRRTAAVPPPLPPAVPPTAAPRPAVGVFPTDKSLDHENTLFIDTPHGRIVIKLRRDIAPKHAERLKQLTREKYYDNVPFHRVIEGFMAQTGDGTKGDGTGGSKYPNVPAEFSQVPFTRGIVGMARRGGDENSANSQFFIMYSSAPSLDRQYTVIGEVLSGMDVVDKIKKGARDDNGRVTNPDRIIRMQVAADTR